MSSTKKSEAKYRELYPSLNDIDLAVEELDLPVSVYNFLKRNSINNVQLLLDMSENDLISIRTHSGRQSKFVENIVYKLNKLSDEISNHYEKREDAGHIDLKIEIESRESIETRAKLPFPPHTALISIADMDYDFATLENKPEYLMQIKFDDISTDVFDELFNGYPTIANAMRGVKELNLFTDEQAEEIAGFIQSILDKAELLICQCEYGQSRSAGLAAAVNQFLNKSGIEVFADDLYYPNKLVYRKVLTALEENKV